MGLDLERTVPQISGMVDRIRIGEPDHASRLDLAVKTMFRQVKHSEALREKCLRSENKTVWPVPGIMEEGLAFGIVLPPKPDAYMALATDGSSLEADRHRSASCYLINIGQVMLSYGAEPSATLENIPFLYFEDSQLVVSSPDVREQDVHVEGPILGAKRQIEECGALCTLARQVPHGTAAVALLDGSLVLWDLVQQKLPGFALKALVGDGLLKHFDQLLSLIQMTPIAFGSYISSPRSSEVMNLLRVALCPHDDPDCDRDCRSKGREPRPCDQISGLRDCDVFGRLLASGSRSAVFRSRSKMVEDNYGNHKVCFFYLNVGDEIARVEVPLWMAQRPDLLALAHALIFDQCRLGGGYPVSLSEAHEQAVLTVSDREQFWSLVDSQMEQRGLEVPGTAKSRSKRRPFV